MGSSHARPLADSRTTVSKLYEDGRVAGEYLAQRGQFSWQRLLHQLQTAVLQREIAATRPNSVLELAPGPARHAVGLAGIRQGVMLENSTAMIKIAQERLKQARLDRIWSVVQGSAFELDILGDQNPFDLVYSFRFIRHFDRDERRALYSGIRSRLRTNGTLVFDVVNKRVRDRLDTRTAPAAQSALPVFDMTYEPDSFRTEMNAAGFAVRALVPVIGHFQLQSTISHKLDAVAPALSRGLIGAIERIPATQPLEWVAVCSKS